MAHGLVIDLFAGGGGASTGLEAALGRKVDIAINHDATALAVHEANHPDTEHFQEDIWKVKPRKATRGRPVDVLWASPDCTHFSRAKGGKPKNGKIRSLAWAVARWAAAVKPRLIFVENVREFQTWGPLDPSGQPIKARMGESFHRWCRRMRTLGYQVEHWVLDSSHYGAPTRRKRLFLVARRDGLPIICPKPTHGPGLLPFHSAAEIIDWALPCPSIFERKKPLKPKTLWRIAQGLRRFVFEDPNPFVVEFQEGQLSAPYLLKANHGGGEGRKPEARGEQLTLPLSTVTASRRGHALAVPLLVQSGYGERPGQRARTLDIREPLGTLVDGVKHAKVVAYLNRHFGETGSGANVSADLRDPMPTVTATDHHSVTAATLIKLRGQCHSSDLREPCPTITAGGTHLAEVRAFLTTYYGSDGTGGQSLRAPLRTVRAKECHGLVVVLNGTTYQVSDILFRMLEPHELKGAQFGRFAKGYDLSKAKTKKAKVKLIGNSVSPEHAEAIILANAPPDMIAQPVAA